jgi:hypothetical protein
MHLQRHLPKTGPGGLYRQSIKDTFRIWGGGGDGRHAVTFQDATLRLLIGAVKETLGFFYAEQAEE